MADEKTIPGTVVLVAVDGSPASLEALRVGHRMAELIGARVLAANIWHVERGSFPSQSWAPAHDSEKLLDNSVREAFHPDVGPPIDTASIEGAAAETLVRLSADAEMLVIGNRGHSGIARLLLGSVSAVCAAHAGCPVLVVHSTPPHAGTDLRAVNAKLCEADVTEGIILGS